MSKKGHGAPVGNRNAAGPHLGHGRAIKGGLGASALGGAVGAGVGLVKIGGPAAVAGMAKAATWSGGKIALNALTVGAIHTWVNGPIAGAAATGIVAGSQMAGRHVAREALKNAGTSVAVGAAAGLAAYGVYKGYQHYKKKGKK